MARMALGLVPGQSSSSTSSGASESSVGTGSAGSSEQSTATSGGHIVSSGPKRGRLLIRQQRIKKESDSSSAGPQPYEPDTPSDDNSPTAQYGHQNIRRNNLLITFTQRLIARHSVKVSFGLCIRAFCFSHQGAIVYLVRSPTLSVCTK